MKNPIDEALARALVRWVDAVSNEARTVAIGLGLVTLALLFYAGSNLGINSDNLRLVGEDFPARKLHLEFSELFPNLDNTLLVLVDAETSELARESTLALAERMRADSDRFTDVYLPGGGDFFELNGLMYRSVDELLVMPQCLDAMSAAVLRSRHLEAEHEARGRIVERQVQDAKRLCVSSRFRLAPGARQREVARGRLEHADGLDADGAELQERAPSRTA